MHLVERRVTKLWTWQSGAQFLVWARDFALLQNVQTNNGVQPASYSVGPKGYIPGDKVPGVGRSTQTPKLNPRPAHMGFVVDKVPEWQVSLQVLCFPPPLSFHQTSTLSHSKYHWCQQLTISLNNTPTYMNDWSYTSTPPICLYDMQSRKFTFKILQYSMPT